MVLIVTEVADASPTGDLSAELLVELTNSTMPAGRACRDAAHGRRLLAELVKARLVRRAGGRVSRARQVRQALPPRAMKAA